MYTIFKQSKLIHSRRLSYSVSNFLNSSLGLYRSMVTSSIVIGCIFYRKVSTAKQEKTSCVPFIDIDDQKKEMERQISTSISDLVLAAATFHCAYKVSPTSLAGSAGFLIIAVAASIGALRFCLDNPASNIIAWHEYFSWLGSVIAVPLLASAYHRQNNISIMANAHLASGLAIIILKNYLTEKAVAMATEAVSTAAVVSIGLVNLVQFNAHGMIGSVVYAVSGLVIKTEGAWHGVPRVDLFHYSLVLGNIAYMMGLSLQPPPIYYKPS